jgi:hypothetical protein
VDFHTISFPWFYEMLAFHDYVLAFLIGTAPYFSKSVQNIDEIQSEETFNEYLKV